MTALLQSFWMNDEGQDIAEYAVMLAVKRASSKRINMCALILACSVPFVSAFVAVPAECQEDTSSSQPTNHNAVEGTVVSSTRNTLVVRTDDNQYQLFTYDRGAVRPASL